MLMYDFIYQLKPVKEVEPGWYKLRWRPIKHKYPYEGTWNFYIHKTYCGGRTLGFQVYSSATRNGWNRGWDDLHVCISLWWFEVEAWVKWNIIVHEDGPMDVAKEDKRPLDLSEFVKT